MKQAMGGLNMPTYEYQCTPCDLKFEVKRGFSEGPGASCPECQCQAQRIFSPVPIVFKGLGFYVTDNAAEGKNGHQGKRNGDKPAEEASDVKPAKNKTGEKTLGAEPVKTKTDEVKVC
jgi:putative FmdB family regulatory protein